MKDLCKDLCKLIVPALTPALHKGQAGRIGIVGGCEEYTGAPYFAGIAALRLGADLVHIMCTPSAAIPIKSYCPDLMVMPILCKEKAPQFSNWIKRLHCVVIGPGLGRDPETKDIVSKWIEIIKEQNIPVIIDADGLHLITEQPHLIKGYKDAILTPNIAEFSRLFHAMNSEQPQKPILMPSDISTLSKVLECTIVCKGKVDKISTNGITVECDVEGSNRRVGGQGDLLSGALGLFAHWAKDSKDSLPCYIPYQNVAAYAACAVVKRSNYEGFHHVKSDKLSRGRSMITSDMVEHLNKAFSDVFGRG
ncbi:ATP-dependent (S)-NAD(P)H-hydrate dehydratase-like [Bolinopsis microptera]|uniref:ATP-dependent (S)-NAD(P)H-hydrate dehydratase-like n=1 Tax=Bolinopsis microptera TaxID=2820187 RepID=UPI003079CA45